MAAAENGEMPRHYMEIASRYDEHWDYGRDHVPWMAERIIQALRLTPRDRIADIGSGTGLFAKEVVRTMRPEHDLLCIDPSAAMLRQLGKPPPDGLRTLRASAEEIADGTTPLPPSHDRLDAIWMKEAVHHLANPAPTLAGLSRRLAPGGRLLVVMLPKTIAYPLFPAALRRFEEAQPDPRLIAQHCADAGLTVSRTQVARTVRIDRERYIRMVRARYMSVLSTFSDAEIESGIEWMRDTFTADELVFPDQFAFVVGLKEHGDAVDG